MYGLLWWYTCALQLKRGLHIQK
jgi:hypothetical protein